MAELYDTFFNPIDIRLNATDVSTASLVNFYTELLHQWRVAYRNRNPDEEDLEVEGLALRKYMTHVGQICLAGQVVSNDYPEDDISR